MDNQQRKHGKHGKTKQYLIMVLLKNYTQELDRPNEPQSYIIMTHMILSLAGGKFCQPGGLLEMAGLYFGGKFSKQEESFTLCSFEDQHSVQCFLRMPSMYSVNVHKVSQLQMCKYLAGAHIN